MYQINDPSSMIAAIEMLDDEHTRLHLKDKQFYSHVRIPLFRHLPLQDPDRPAPKSETIDLVADLETTLYMLTHCRYTDIPLLSMGEGRRIATEAGVDPDFKGVEAFEQRGRERFARGARKILEDRENGDVDDSPSRRRWN